MAERVEIDIIANNLADAAFTAIQNKLTALGGKFASVGGVAVAAFAAIVTGAKKAVDMAQEYDQQVYSMTLATGMMAEETGRMIQVVDDMGISYDTLKTAMKHAIKNGIEPSIDSLAQLSDKYLAMNSDVERGQFLLDTFGRSGLEMSRAMALGGDAIREMSEAVDDSLVPTAEAIEQSEEWRRNVDDLEDSWKGFWTGIGNSIIPALNDLFDATERNAEIAKIMAELNMEEFASYGQAAKAHMLAAATLEYERRVRIAAADATAEHGDALDRATAAANGNVSAIEELPGALEKAMRAQEALLNQTISLTESARNHDEQLSELVGTRERETAILDGLISRYGETSAKVAEQRDKIAELDGQIENLITTQERQRAMFILSMMQQSGATVKMQTAFALAAGLIDQKTYDMVNDIDTVTDAIGEQGDQLLNNKQFMRDFIMAVKEADGLEAFIDIYINTHGKIPKMPKKGAAYWSGEFADSGTYKPPAEEEQIYGGAVARGGDVSAGRLYSVGEYGREFFAPKVDGRIIPDNKMGGGIVVNLTYAPMISGFNRDEVTSKLLPFIRDGMRQIARGA